MIRIVLDRSMQSAVALGPTPAEVLGFKWLIERELHSMGSFTRINVH